MKVTRSFSISKFNKSNQYLREFKSTPIRDNQNRLHVALYSEFFSESSANYMHTNSMYNELKSDIMSSIAPYSTKEQIVIDVFETNDSSDFSRESAIIGFRRFITSCYAGENKQHIAHFFLFSAFLVMGIFIEYLLCLNITFIPQWVLNCFEVVSWVFIWQFAVYMAFEFAGEIKNLRRLAQMLTLDFEFKHWE